MEFCGVMSDILLVSEKAANVARICRRDEHLLSLLVQEKNQSEKNPRFVNDFKTFADVLVQEVVKAELTWKYPTLSDSIYGEESNEFDCGKETVIVKVCSTPKETKNLIDKVLCDDVAASTLAEEVHRNLYADDLHVEGVSSRLPKNVGVWIDPIDSTAEYISGSLREIAPGLSSGLPCVTVLIGLFDKITGDPVAGVINRPFCQSLHSVWTGESVYGLCTRDYTRTGPSEYPQCSKKIVAVSSSEDLEVKAALTDNGYEVLEVPGAGYKLFLIITGVISAYILSRPTTYFWDTCAPHAILKSQGGNILNYTTLKPLKYTPGSSLKECCNSGGILAYRDEAVKHDLIKIIRSIPRD